MPTTTNHILLPVHKQGNITDTPKLFNFFGGILKSVLLICKLYITNASAMFRQRSNKRAAVLPQGRSG